MKFPGKTLAKAVVIGPELLGGAVLIGAGVGIAIGVGATIFAKSEKSQQWRQGIMDKTNELTDNLKERSNDFATNLKESFTHFVEMAKDKFSVGKEELAEVTTGVEHEGGAPLGSKKNPKKLLHTNHGLHN